MQVFCFSWAINKTVDSIWIVLSAFGWFVKFSNRRQTMRFVPSMCTHFFCSFKRIVQLKSISYHDLHPSPVSSLKMDNLWTTYRNELTQWHTWEMKILKWWHFQYLEYFRGQKRASNTEYPTRGRTEVIVFVFIPCIDWFYYLLS